MNNVRWSILAAALVAAAVSISAAPCQGASEKRIPEWIAQLGHVEGSIRTSAADQLVRLPAKDVLKPLTFALKDANWQVRGGAAGVLGRLKDKRAVERLCVLLKDDIWAVRKEAAAALGLLKDNRAYKALVAALGDEDPVVADAALAALEKLQSELTHEAIVAAAASSSPLVRRKAIRILRKSRDKKAYEVFLRALTDEDFDVRIVALYAIAELRIADKKAVKPLIKLLSDEKSAARQRAVTALGIIGDKAAIKPLLAIMQQDPETFVRRDAITSLIKLKGRTAATDLIDILPKQTEFTEVILDALRRFCDPRADDAALKALSDDRAPVRVQAVAILGCLGDHQAVKPLCELLQKDPEPVVQIAAAKALGRLGDEQAVDALIAAMKHPRYQVRQPAVTSLSVIGVEKALKAVRKALKSSDNRVRTSAISMLGEIGDKRSYKALLAALGEKDMSVRKAAVIAMETMGDEKAIEPLIKVLGARLRNQPSTEENAGGGVKYSGYYVEPWWRSRACTVLARIGGPKAADALMTALEDPEDAVVLEAACALGEMGDRRAVKPLTEIMLENISLRARLGAVIGLCKLGIRAAYRPGPAVLSRVSYKVDQVALAEALAKHVDRGRTDKLISQLKHEDAKVRGAAAHILGFAKDARAVVPLIECLDDPDKYTRRAMAQALGRLADERATKPLIKLLEDKDVYFVRAVAAALGRIGDRRAVGPLNAILPRARFRFSRWEVPVLVALARLEPKRHVAELRRAARAAQYNYDRQAAVELLAEVEGRRAIPDLKRALRDEDRSVRDAARKALKGINKTDDSLPIGQEE